MFKLQYVLHVLFHNSAVVDWSFFLSYFLLLLSMKLFFFTTVTDAIFAEEHKCYFTGCLHIIVRWSNDATKIMNSSSHLLFFSLLTETGFLWHHVSH